MEQIKPPVKALDDGQLENISGGLDPASGLQMFGLGIQTGQQLSTAVLAPLSVVLDDYVFNAKYGDALKVMASYNNNTEYSFEEKAVKFADSWNNHHKGGGMTFEIASAILSLKDKPNAQVQIACQPTITEVVTAYNTFAQSGA